MIRAVTGVIYGYISLLTIIYIRYRCNKLGGGSAFFSGKRRKENVFMARFVLTVYGMRIRCVSVAGGQARGLSVVDLPYPFFECARCHAAPENARRILSPLCLV